MFLTPEQQHQIDERWKDYNKEWTTPQSMSRDQTALELEKFRYETEARYREDQLRESWKRSKSNNADAEFSNVTQSDREFYQELGTRSEKVENRSRKFSSRNSSDADSFGWFLTGCFCTLILLYIFA